MSSQHAIDAAILKAGSATALAQALNVTPQVLNNWRNRGVPADKCKAVAAVTGISLKVLRPDDWAAYWPELDSAQV